MDPFSAAPGKTWKSVKFVASTKSSLCRALASAGAVIDRDKEAEFDLPPPTFAEWRERQPGSNFFASRMGDRPMTPRDTKELAPAAESRFAVAHVHEAAEELRPRVVAEGK